MRQKYLILKIKENETKEQMMIQSHIIDLERKRRARNSAHDARSKTYATIHGKCRDKEANGEVSSRSKMIIDEMKDDIPWHV